MEERTTLLVRTHLDSLRLVDEYQKLQAENEQLKKDLEHSRSYKHRIKMRSRNLQAENERLKAELKQTKAQDQVVINGLRKENRKTLHALWMARVLRAYTEKLFYFNLGMNTISEKWAWVERKCREKAKEFE